MNKNPKEIEKFGAWPNGTYFNALWFSNQDKKNFQGTLGIDFAFNWLMTINDEFYYLKSEHQQLMNIVRVDPSHFLKRWNSDCWQEIKKIQEYTKKYQPEDYTLLTLSQLAGKLKEFQDKLRPLFVYLMTYPATAEAVEEYIAKNMPHLNFNELHPLFPISTEKIYRELLAGVPLPEVQQKYSWYGLQLLRGKPLTLSDVQELKKVARRFEPIVESKDPLLQELQLFMWLKFERIDAFNQALDYMAPLFKEIFHRISLDLRYWEILLPPELEHALLNGKLSSDLDKRFQNRGVLLEENKVCHLSAAEISEYNSFLKVEEFNSILKGRVACPGKVQGTAKIIRDLPDLQKVNNNDVFIARETLVQYEPQMRKSKAMVVEAGGLLSHAAIFAREFKIPTIIGVSNATKVFKDGDLVEVDAEKGVVRKIDK